jgi:DNA-binding PadR family transcriptional regulator
MAQNVLVLSNVENSKALVTTRVRASRSDLIRRILIVLDGNPSSVYDILYSLNDFSDPKRTRLPKLLKSMERDGLVTSALQPGPLGPYRRIYEHGPGASEYLKEQLRCGIETLMHFYLRYRSTNHTPGNSRPIEPNGGALQGNALFAAYPNMTVDQLESIRRAVTSSEDVIVSIIGPDQILSRSGIEYRVVGNTLSDIDAEDETFDYIQLDGVPPRAELAPAISELERVLASNGVLRILTPLAFFEEPRRFNLEQFVRVTASNLFPEVGIIEGKDVMRAMENTFGKTEIFDTEDGRIAFVARKS